MNTTSQNTVIVPHYLFSTPYEIIYKKGDNKYPIGPHSHDGIEFYLTLSPLPDILLNETVSRVEAGTLIVIPPNCIHQLFQDKHQVYERYIVSIDINWLGTVLSGHSDHHHTVCTQLDTPLLIPLSENQIDTLCTAMDLFMQKKESSAFCILADFFHLLNRFEELLKTSIPAKPVSSVSSTQETVNRIISYIQEHLSEQITTATLANHFFLHPDYIARLFKKHTHTTLSHYINLQKMTKARYLLETGKSVSQVQEALGYSSYAYFFKTFQKHVGLSPKQYKLLYKRTDKSS